MKKLVLEIEKSCNLCFKTQVSGINFEVFCPREISKNLFLDMIQYLPNRDIDLTEYRPLRIFYINSEAFLNYMHKRLAKEIGKSVVVYHSRTIHKEAQYYQLDDINVFYCDVDPYYMLQSNDNLYVIISEKTSSASRLYFRIMIEFVLRAKELMGYHLIHAASVRIGNCGFLICGNKGAGKTTLLSHLLRGRDVEFIANDKVFLSSDMKRIEYFPLAARVGEGTVKKFKEYDLSASYHRIDEMEKKTAKENLSNEKWEFTPKEIADIFNCGYVPDADFAVVLIPQIGQCDMLKIDERVSDILEYDLFKSESKYKVPNWLLNESWVEYFKSKKVICSNGLENTYKSYLMKYGYHSKSKDIIDIVDNVI